MRTFKPWIAGAFALLLGGSVARADTYEEHDTFTAVFSFVRVGPDGQQMLAGSTTAALPISLPPALAEWRCERRPQIAHGSLRDDPQSKHRRRVLSLDFADAAGFGRSS
jgi:hypothetical protein